MLIHLIIHLFYLFLLFIYDIFHCSIYIIKYFLQLFMKYYRFSRDYLLFSIQELLIFNLFQQFFMIINNIFQHFLNHSSQKNISQD